jgi:hypothetical protein
VIPDLSAKPNCAHGGLKNLKNTQIWNLSPSKQFVPNGPDVIHKA